MYGHRNTCLGMNGRENKGGHPSLVHGLGVHGNVHPSFAFKIGCTMQCTLGLTPSSSAHVYIYIRYTLFSPNFDMHSFMHKHTLVAQRSIHLSLLNYKLSLGSNKPRALFQLYSSCCFMWISKSKPTLGFESMTS